MDLSGIIFVVLALAWAGYLVPKVLKHHDEIARTRSVDRFSNAMRVLARREPGDRGTARLVVTTPARTADRVLLPSRPEGSAADTATDEVAGPRPPARAAARRAAARAAARRRRRVLAGLLVGDLVIVGLSLFALLPWWSGVVPVTLTLVYLFLCRTQVRRENDASWTSETRSTTVAPRRAIRVDASYGAAPVAQAGQAGQAGPEFCDEEDTVQLPVTALETVAVSVETVDGSSLWDPLPVTLPTYVGKARAARTVRTIDLAAPDTWTSGRDDADSALVEEAVAAETEATEDQARRAARPAVGS